MANPRIPVVELGGGRPASGDSARAALVDPVSKMEARSRLAGGLGAALDAGANLAAKVADHFKKQDTDRDQIEAVQLEGRVLAGIDEDKAKLDPMSHDYATQIKEIINRHTTGGMADAQFRTREVRDETSRRLARIGATAELVAAEDRRKSIAGEAERVYKERLDTLYGQIRKDPDASDTYMAAFQADAARLRSGISPDRLRVISHAAADGMLAAKVEGYAQRGNFAGARKFLDDNSGSFTPETNRALRANIMALESKARSDYALASTEAAARLRIDIIKQQDPDAKPTVTRDTLDLAVKSGRVRPQDADSLYATLAVADRQRGTEIERNRAVVANFSTRTLNNEADGDRMLEIIMRGVADKAGKDRTKLDILGSEEGMQALGIYVDGVGAVPPSVARQIENLANSGGPGSGDMGIVSLAKAAAVHKMLKERAPNIANLKNNDRINLVLEHAKANGGDITQAARDVMKNIPDEKAAAERLAHAREFARKTDWAKESTVVLGDWFDRQLSYTGSLLRTGGRLLTYSQVTETLGMGAAVPRGRDDTFIPQGMIDEMKQNFERHFRLSNHKETALKAAADQVKREWSVTYVAGDKTPYVMKHAPASFLPPEREWLRGDLDSIMAENVDALFKREGTVLMPREKTLGRPAYILEADDRTRQEAALKDPKTPPSFQIRVLREDGLYHVVGNGRARLPTDDELKRLPMYGDRLQQFDAAGLARDAREELERRAADKANRRKAK